MTDVTSSPPPRATRSTCATASWRRSPAGIDGGALAWGRQRLFLHPAQQRDHDRHAAVPRLGAAAHHPVLFIDAVWSGENREACLPADGQEVARAGRSSGEVRADPVRPLPIEERWRVELTGLFFVIGLVALAVPKIPYKGVSAYLMLVVFRSSASFCSMAGRASTRCRSPSSRPSCWCSSSCPLLAEKRAVGVALGLVLPLLIADAVFGAINLPVVETSLWGGLMVTLVVAVTGIVASLPLGILLALGPQVEAAVVKFASVVFIEFWRGVPLITVLFMASVMLPLFLPTGVNFDKLLRALIGVALFLGRLHGRDRARRTAGDPQGAVRGGGPRWASATGRRCG